MKEHPRKSQILAKAKTKPEIETEQTKRPLPIWCIGIMAAASIAADVSN